MTCDLGVWIPFIETCERKRVPKQSEDPLRKQVCSCLASALILGIAGCGWLSRDTTERALQDIDQLLKIVDDQSKSWQSTLQILEDKTAKDTQSTIRTEVDTLVQRSVAATGAELKCNFDFMRDRVRQHLLNIKAALMHKPGTQIKPLFCQVVPSQVDQRLAADRRAVVSFVGYDMDIGEPARVRVFLVDNAGQEVDVTDKITNPTHYLMTLNISSGSGVQFQPTSNKLVLRWGADVLSSIAVLREPAPFKAEVSVNAVGPSDAPSVSATVPSGYRLIGGGCHSEWQGAGQLLTASYPVGSSWMCTAKAHAVMDMAGLTAYVLYIPDNLKIDISITSASSGAASNQPDAKATIPPGYSVIGGGCQTSWKKPEPGNLLVNSYPVSDGWLCAAKAHSVSSPATLTSYVIGVRSADFTVIAGPPDMQGPRSNVRNSASSTIAGGQGVGLAGGGCKINYGGAGQLLTASYPDRDNNRWMCESKDHQVSDSATITAYSLGLKANRP